MKSRGLFAYLIYAQFFKELVDTGDILSLQADLSRTDYFKNGEKLWQWRREMLNHFIVSLNGEMTCKTLAKPFHETFLLKQGFIAANAILYC